MKLKAIIVSVSALAAIGLRAELPLADFTQEVGKIRPELHSSGFGPTICSQTAQDLADVKAMGFKAARTHDWALVNSNERCCDWHHIFPLVHLDAKDPKNYVFKPTDYLLKRTREETGLDIFYRLGTSIEHSGDKVHFNTLIPEDFDKVAEVFAGTVRHYNRGWADGFQWNIRYWEIWNEPDGLNNMFCLPEGDAGKDDADWERKETLRRAKFVELFVMCLKRLKGEFGDSIKVGGPALCNVHPTRVAYFREILKACKAAGVAPDFLSWHGYINDPLQFNREADMMRKLCDEYGFTKCELIVNEWHYFGTTYDWTDMQRCSDPAVKARIWEGPDSHNGIRSAAFTLATLANLQSSQLAQAYYYGCSHVGSWGFKDALQKKYKVFYALKLFGDIVRDYTTRCASTPAGTVTPFAVKDAKGRKALLVADYGGTDRKIEIAVKGLDTTKKPKVTILDNTHDLVPFVPTQAWDQVYFKDGKLVIWKPDFFSAAFFVEMAD